MLKGEQINLIVAASNVAGIPLLFVSNNSIYTFIFSLTLLFSILMHLSEKKHNLPGVYPLNVWSHIFLWCDRIMAYICGFICCAHLYNHWSMVPNWLFNYGIFGISLGLISEVIINNQWTSFVIMHCSWHYVAYNFIYLVMIL